MHQNVDNALAISISASSFVSATVSHQVPAQYERLVEVVDPVNLTTSLSTTQIIKETYHPADAVKIQETTETVELRHTVEYTHKDPLTQSEEVKRASTTKTTCSYETQSEVANAVEDLETSNRIATKLSITTPLTFDRS